MASYLLIANPVAGGGAGARRAEALRTLLAGTHAVRLMLTTGRGSATELAAAHGGEADRVVAVGGDGTLNEVLRGLWGLGDSAGTRPALGFLAGGTANVATRAFGFTADPERAARDLEARPERAADVGIAGGEGWERPFLLWCGAGFDAVVIDHLNATRTGRMGLRGLAMRAPGIVSAVVRYPAPPISLRLDGEGAPSAESVILANVAPIAVGGTVHPGADPFDGGIDVVSAGSTTALGLLGLGLRTLGSALSAGRGVVHRVATEVELSSDGRVPVQIDGEPAGTLPLRVRLVAGAVRLVGVTV